MVYQSVNRLTSYYRYFHGKYFVTFNTTVGTMPESRQKITGFSANDDNKTIQNSDSAHSNPLVADLVMQFGYHQCRRRKNIL